MSLAGLSFFLSLEPDFIVSGMGISQLDELETGEVEVIDGPFVFEGVLFSTPVPRF